MRVCCSDTREEVLEVCFNSSNTQIATPEEFARLCVACCKWVGGQQATLLGWERNSPGIPFAREVYRLNYLHVLGNPDLVNPKEVDKAGWGWNSTRDSKLALFSDLRSSISRGEYVTHDLNLVQELESTIYYPAGGIGPASLINEPGGAAAAHGDRCVAAAGANLLLRRQPKYVPPKPVISPGSYLGRRKAYEKSKKVRI
jgi:hypothetical protein